MKHLWDALGHLVDAYSDAAQGRRENAQQRASWALELALTGTRTLPEVSSEMLQRWLADAQAEEQAAQNA